MMRLVAGLLLLLLTPREAQTKPEQAAKAFYAYHFAHAKEFTRQALAARKRWIAPELYGLLSYELGRPTKPDEPPYIEGDPFTNSQEYPSGYRLGKAHVSGGKANVPVSFSWTERGKVIQTKRCSVKLVRQGGRWLIADVVSEDGTSLVRDLRELKRQDGKKVKG